MVPYDDEHGEETDAEYEARLDLEAEEAAVAAELAAAAAAIAAADELKTRDLDREKAIREGGPGTTRGITKLDPTVSEPIDVSVGISDTQILSVQNEIKYESLIIEKQEAQKKLELAQANAKKLITDKKLAEYNAIQKDLAAHKKMLENIRDEIQSILSEYHYIEPNDYGNTKTRQ